MYQCSDAFHEAVLKGNEQKAMLIFEDCVFTDEDISVENGITFNEYFNTETDLAIGQALSNEISFTLFNDERKLNNYEFGDFLATIGVYISEKTYTQSGPVMVHTNKHTYVGNTTYPYFTRDGVQLPSVTGRNFPIRSILAYDGKVWGFGDNGQHVVYKDDSGAPLTDQGTLTEFMKAKVQTWFGKGIFYNKDSRYLFVYQGGVEKIYEFVPLGYFTAERPKAPDMIQIDMTCYDRMQKFDDDMPSSEDLGITYPTTFSNLFVKLCQHLEVSYVTSTFINSTAKINKAPDDFQYVTMREVLKWIAEAAGSNAVFNRDGKLELKWLKDTEQTYTANNFVDFNPHWYKTKKITKLYNRDTQESTETTYGSGKESYLIQNNPLLKGVS